MSEYITRIRTEQGDKQIDYNFLANLPQSDPTLAQSGKFADAKVVGDKIKSITDDVTQLNNEMQELNDGVGSSFESHINSTATDSQSGHMSADDKAKLDGVEQNANNYSLPVASKSSLGGVKTTSDISSAAGLTACPIIDGVPYCKNVDTVATTAEMNLLSGLTSVSEKPKTQTITLASGSWIDKCQTVSVSGVTSNSIVMVSPDPYTSNYDAYMEASIRCISQSSGQLTFSCKYDVKTDVSVHVVILG